MRSRAKSLLPTRCAGCDRPGAVVCGSCRAAFVAPPPLPARLRPAVALGRHSGALRRCVLALKYRDAPAVAGALAPMLALVVEAAGFAVPDAVVPAPTTAARVRKRGYDPAAVIAAALAAELGLAVASPLVRRPGPAQQDAHDRAARVAPRPFRYLVAGVPPPACLVVDDVVTTGTTLAAARRALVAHGCAVSTVVVSAAPISSRVDGPHDPDRMCPRAQT